MSWNNVIPSSVIQGILDDLEKEPKQLHFDEELFSPCFFIKEEYITSCNEAFTWVSATGHGPNGTISKHVDHPAFAALRKHLATRGLINVESSWVNGDRVIKSFHLNNVPFKPGEKFLCADAMATYLKRRERQLELSDGHYDFA